MVNQHSDFLAHGFLTGVDVIGTLGLSYVTSLELTPYQNLEYTLGFVDRHTYLHVDIYIFRLFNFFFKRRPVA